MRRACVSTRLEPSDSCVSHGTGGGGQQESGEDYMLRSREGCLRLGCGLFHRRRAARLGRAGRDSGGSRRAAFGASALACTATGRAGHTGGRRHALVHGLLPVLRHCAIPSIARRSCHPEPIETPAFANSPSWEINNSANDAAAGDSERDRRRMTSMLRLISGSIRTAMQPGVDLRSA